MKFFIVSFILFTVASIFFLGEAAWIIFLCLLVCRFALLTSRPIWIRVLIATIGCAALAAHFSGYKIFGSPTVHDNRPILESPLRLSALIAPNIILSEDGSRFALRGVVFDPLILTLSHEDLEGIFNRIKGPVVFQTDPTSPSGLILQVRCDYWCGNTFFPTIFPKRLPAYTKIDMARYLVNQGLAEKETSE